MTLSQKSAFDIITAAEYNELLALVQNPYVKKTANQIRNNTTTFVTDLHLTVPITSVSRTYTFLLWLIVNTGVTPDFKFGWNVPTGATMAWSAQEGNAGALAAVLQGPFIESSVVPINGSGVDAIVKAEGQLFVGANTGTFSLRWDQNTATVSDTTVKLNSYLQLWPV